MKHHQDPDLAAPVGLTGQEITSGGDCSELCNWLNGWMVPVSGSFMAMSLKSELIAGQHQKPTDCLLPWFSSNRFCGSVFILTMLVAFFLADCDFLPMKFQVLFAPDARSRQLASGFVFVSLFWKQVLAICATC